MASNGFTVHINDRDLLKALDRIGNETQQVITTYLKTEAMKWQRDIRKTITQNKSVVTGDLRRSISVNPQGKWSYVVGTNLFYAPFVEYGTRQTTNHRATNPHPYIQPVYDNNADKFRAEITAILKECLR